MGLSVAIVFGVDERAWARQSQTLAVTGLVFYLKLAP